MILPRFPRLRSLSPSQRAHGEDLALFTAVAAAVVGPWVGRGWLLLLDWTAGPRTTVTPGVYGLDANQADAMPARLGFVILRTLVGAQAAAWVPVALAIVLGGVGMARLMDGPRVRRWTAGLLFTVNPWVFDRIRAGHVWLLLAVATLPWLLRSAAAARREGRWFRVRTALWLAAATAVSPHLFWIGGALLAITWLFPRPRWRDMVRLVLTLVGAVASAGYGVVVALVGARTSSIDARHLDAFATRGGGMLGTLGEVLTLQGFWREGSEPRDLLGPFWLLLVAGLFAVAARGWSSRRSAAGMARSVPVVMVAGGALLAAGDRGPLGPVYRLAFDHLPMFHVMREPQKFAVLVALGLAVLAGHGAEAVAAQWQQRRHLPRPLATAPLLLLPLALTPTLFWGLGGEVTASAYPGSWAQAEALMGSGDGAVLVLPWHEYQAYDFTAGRTVRTPAAAYFSRDVITSESPELSGIPAGTNSPRHAYLQQVLARAASIHHLGRLVAPLGVQYVLVTTTTADPELPSWLDDQTDLHEVLRTDDLVLYENTVAGTGRVGGMCTVTSVGEYVDLVEAGAVGTEAVVVDTASAGTDTCPRSTSAGGLSVESATRYAVADGEAGWVVVPAVAANGWAVGGTRGTTTVQGVLAVRVGEAATTVVYTPWTAVRLGYVLSFLSTALLVGLGLLEHRERWLDRRPVVVARRHLAAWWARFRRGTAPAYVGVWLVATGSVTSWFRPGTFIATGDMAPYIRTGWQAEGWWSWGHNITGAGSATYTVARWYELLLSRTVLTLGGTDTLAQRLLYMTIYPMVALAVASVVAVFTRNRLAIFAAGSFAVLNGFFLTRLPNPLNIISVGSTALVAAVGLRVAKGQKVRASLLALAMLPMSFLAYNPPMLVVALAWTAAGVPLLGVLIFGRPAVTRILRYALSAAPWALLVNVFWLLPFAQAFGGGGGASATAQTDPTAWAWSQAENSIPNVLTLSANWAWHKPQYLPFTPALDEPWWYWLRFLLPVLIALAPWVARPRHRRAAVTLSTFVVVFTLLGKGLQPPLTGLNSFLYARVPGFWLFREPMSKLGQLLVLFDALLIALLIDGAAARLRGRARLPKWSGRGILAAAVVGVLVWPYPLFTGAVIPDVRPKQPSAHVAVPSYWRSTATMIDEDPTAGKVLVLPLDDYYQMPTTWGFSGSDTLPGLVLQRPVLQRKPDGYFGDTPGVAAQVDAVERALVTGDTAAVAPLLESLGVAFVIVRHDLQVGDPLRTFTDPDLLRAAAAAVPELEEVQLGALDVYRVGDGSDVVRTTADPLVVPADPDAIADIVASVPDGTVVTGAEDAATVTMRETVPGDDALVTDDAVWWPVPAVETGAPSTTFETTGGTYTLSQRNRASVAVVPAETLDPENPDESVLLLVDPTVVVVDGEAVSVRDAVTVPITGQGVVAVTAGNRSVSLDGWLQADLPVGTSGAEGPPEVILDAATDVTAYGLADEQPTLAAYSDVYDCNNYEPRPQAELQLTADVFSADGMEHVQLGAADHAACVTSAIDGVTAGDTVRVRIEYRTVEGKRPQVCLLETYTDGTTACVADARLQRDEEWGRYELVHTLGDDVVSAKVVLYANVGLRLSDPTVSEYRGLTVEALTAMGSATVAPGDVPPVTVELAAGTHTLELLGGAYGSVLAPFEALEDCFRYDDLSVEEAQLAATTATDDGTTVYELRAKDHMACIAAAMQDYGGAGLYTFEYEYRSVALRKAKACIYERGPNVCEPLPANGSETEWTTYEQQISPRLASLETRLYLYGLRDLAGEDQSIVQYRNVRVTPTASATAVVLVRVPDGQATVAAPVEVLHPTPATYTVTLDGITDGAVVTLAETWAPGWSLAGLPEGVTATRLRLDGYQNAWQFDGSFAGEVEIRLVYAPALTARTALKVSALVVPMAWLWLVVGGRVRRRLRWWRMTRSGR